MEYFCSGCAAPAAPNRCRNGVEIGAEFGVKCDAECDVGFGVESDVEFGVDFDVEFDIQFNVDAVENYCEAPLVDYKRSNAVKTHAEFQQDIILTAILGSKEAKN